jgi:hypothetical protein
MKPAAEYARYFSWLTPRRALVIVLLSALICVFEWPRSDLAAELVLLATIAGLVGAVIWLLTFWRKARIRIGGLNLRYKRVRAIGGAVALVCLPFLLVQRISLRMEARERRQIVAK